MTAVLHPLARPYEGRIARDKVVLAPMSGITDVPFRKLAREFGASLVVSEMIASKELLKGRDEYLLKAKCGNINPHVIQLAGREAHWMAEGARQAEQLGADAIDINMGCPAKQVTRGLSGSALMRDLDHAQSLIDAVVGAVCVPVSLKMRLGWDDASINAPELARRAEQSGVQLLTVHGRTRCQFYKGSADWAKVRSVVDATRLPLLVNGDITSAQDARDSLAFSGAAGVMVGRAACGAPWRLGQIAAGLAGQNDDASESRAETPSLSEKCEIVRGHYEAMLEHYGVALGQRTARKHLGWYVEEATRDEALRKYWRSQLCRDATPAEVLRGITAFYRQCADLPEGGGECDEVAA